VIFRLPSASRPTPLERNTVMSQVRLLKQVAVASSICAAFALTGCTGEASAQAEEGEVIQIATLRQPHLFAPYVYQDFIPGGTIIEVVPMTDSTAIKNAVVNGDVEFGVLGIPSVLAGISQNEDIKVIASAADGGTGIVGNEEIQDVEELSGKKVGYVPGSSQEILLRQTLAQAGMDADTDVELVNIGFADMPDALERGDIDAFSSAEVGPSIAILNGAHRIVSPYETPIGKVNIGLATTGALIESDPELVQRIVDTHVQATDHLLDDEETWTAGVQANFSFDDDVLAQALDNIWLRTEIDEDYVAQVTELGRQMLELGTLEVEPDAGKIFDTTFIEAAGENQP
jgi:NitT/TauT family transport system substrate-binding protein